MSEAGRKLTDRVLIAVPRHPLWALAAVVGLSLVALLHLVDLRTGHPRLLLDPSVDSLLPANDPGREYFEEIKLLFNAGDNALIALATDDVFTSANLERIRRISEQIEVLDQVDYVSSLSSALNIRAEGDEIVTDPFYERVPTDAAALAELRARALADPIYAGNLVSRDGRIAVIAVQLLDISEQELISSGFDAVIAEIAERERGDAEVWLSGSIHVKSELNRLLLEDITLIVPIQLLLIAVIALVSFRTLRGLAIPLFTIGIAALWMLACLAAAVGTLNQVTVAIAPIVIVVGFAYALHVVSAYYDVVRKGSRDSVETVRRVLEEISIPIFFTGLTTAAGFLSLTLSPLSAIRQFGIFAALGIFFAMFVALLFAPALLTLLPVPDRVRSKAEGDGDGFGAWLRRLAHFDMRHRTAILAAGGALALLSALGVARIEVGTDVASNFKESARVRLDIERVNAHLQGANAFQIVIESDVYETFKAPENLAVLDALQQWLEAQPEVGGTTSLADYLKLLNQSFREGAPEQYRIPESRELVSQLLVIGGNHELERFIDSDYQIANLAVRTRAMDSTDVMRLVERIEAHLAGKVPAHLKATVTGSTVLVSRTMDEIALGQALSIGTALLIIYLILVVLFTSFRAGFIALIPNALPVLVYFGVLGWSGVTLNFTTGLVACLVLGIAVDDTIHLMAHLNAAAKRLSDERKGIVEALVAVGRPVTYTSIALCVGLSAQMLSQLNNQFDFGWLAASTLGVAWLVDVTFTPAIAGRMRIVTLWDVLSLDLGEAPNQSIPLFHGLSERQARVAALMCGIQSFPKNHRLIEMGTRGDEMYVVLDGRLEASVHEDVILRELSRGDVIGEVALFEGERSADVTTRSDVRLLQLDRDRLEHIRRRRPRIGAQLYENISRVLANRLASLSERVH